jgi:hypothetical protein
MDVFEPMFANIKTDFVERKLDAKVIDSHFYQEIHVFFSHRGHRGRTVPIRIVEGTIRPN